MSQEWIEETRIGMRESDFRRMEDIFAAALQKTIIIRVADYFPRMNAKTFCNRFSDARRGFEIYKYASKHFPFTTNLRILVPKVGKDGMVKIQNTEWERFMNMREENGGDRQTTARLLQGAVVHQEEEKIPEMIVKPGSETERRIIEMMEKYKAMGIEPPEQGKE